MRVLIIEDERDIAENIFDYLESRGHVADTAGDGLTGLHLATTQDWDAIILDLRLPGLNGLSLCEKLRNEAQRDTPVLMVTARDTLENKLEGFSRGADDYIVKPFALAEVEARLIALHKRNKKQVVGSTLRVGDIMFDTRTLQVERGGRRLRLAPKCLRILELLMREPNRVWTRAQLEMAVWGDTQPDSDSLRTHMYALRRALSIDGEKDPIDTVHGYGYRLTDEHAHQV